MSSIVQAKAEVQKLIRRYNQLKNEAQEADSAEASSRKSAEAERLALQIRSLQSAIVKLQAVADDTSETFKRAEAEKIEFEARIAYLEQSQEKTRDQIDQLSQAKMEMIRLKSEVDRIASERQHKDDNLQKQLTELLKKTEAEQFRLKQEIEIIRHQAQKDTELLRSQRDTARAQIEEQQRLEKEKLTSLQITLNAKYLRMKSMMAIGVSLGVTGGILLMLIIILVTPLLDHLIKNVKGW
ncbi:hypothetical protein BegalDRAFT_3151 [Beggiatoa alba B18LD]|uniref:Uncharacterized protein n=1 Tax=Beggiatoa alba B18LD TaxID=395493 RepID=I3CK33_9GAMM|nr:hypothetical protein [Beggiatoa alba]EIJ43976.1 hypothetical protein BegalDRAFT_3151 [Beggiatoa alba B18LD]